MRRSQSLSLVYMLKNVTKKLKCIKNRICVNYYVHLYTFKNAMKMNVPPKFLFF